MEPHYYETYYRHETNHWWFRWRYDLVTRIVAGLPPTAHRLPFAYSTHVCARARACIADDVTRLI